MAASLGLGHEYTYAAAYPPPASSYPACFPPPGLVADDDDAVLDFPPAPGAFQDLLLDARAPPADGYYHYSSSAPVVFANAAAAENEMGMLLYRGGGGGGYVDHGQASGSAAGNADAARPSSTWIGFRMRSEVDVLDDGFKWRKYGKKAVKSSPNPRNYYRCSAEGCGVKKRVERDRDDPRYVVTTYDGVHYHAAPGAACYLRASPPCSSASAAPWSGAPSSAAACCSDADWEARMHAAAAVAAAAAHSSESSY